MLEVSRSAAGLLILMSAWTSLMAGAIAPPTQASGYHLVFNEDFRNLDLSPDGNGEHTWYEGVWFNQKHAPMSNISPTSSGLTLVWRRGQEAFDTSITTLAKNLRHSRSWRYGYFEARMKWDTVRGAWPALWLIPVPTPDGKATWKDTGESGEIDIFEGQGDQPHTFFGTVHDWINLHDHPSGNNAFPLPSGTNFDQFHSYGLLWTPGKVTWYFDNQPLHSEATPAIFDHQDYFVVASMQEGEDWKANNLAGVSATQMTMTVDWIHIWQK
ncbi:MAG TPA: glycoside hydrolase family 16 protein [Bryobacteraceae bacterium]|nr:glycoside hydrolase family 16 protein [Bryobacteraceae bacterium]